eukprot:19069-Heterococcus_DN1.PRE.1
MPSTSLTAVAIAVMCMCIYQQVAMSDTHYYILSTTAYIQQITTAYTQQCYSMTDLRSPLDNQGPYLLRAASARTAASLTCSACL